MSKTAAVLERLASLVGITTRYRDAFGNSVETPPETRAALLNGLGLKTYDEAAAQESLARLERLKQGPLPAVAAVTADQPVRLRLRRSCGRTPWRFTQESGEPLEGYLAAGSACLDIPALPSGYHRLQFGDRVTTIIAAPTQCWQPEILRGETRLWGIAAQIYSLRSEEDLGIGDYSHVARIASAVAASGGAFLGLSPVHALFSADRTKISPYSPSSRLFLEPLYIDPSAVDGFNESGAAAMLQRSDIESRLQRRRNTQLIDYAEVWDIKRLTLDRLWRWFQNSGDHPAFDNFRKSGGQALRAHTVFEALSEHFRDDGKHWLGDWPDAYRDVGSESVQRFEMEHAERVSFHAWLQWLADKQLASAAERARGDGMPIGLYRDLAVGAEGAGSEIWTAPDRFAASLSVGAPPDPLGPQGQNWGLPPFNPLVLEEQGLAAFRDLVAANMRHAGAIRIDHAFQLQRLFLIPTGAPASMGAYVDYPFEAMLAVLRVESHRARCLVIAEDLGTGPEGFSQSIMESGILSYRVLPFERAGSGFKRPDQYPRSALSVITTHDLPTFRGWWRGLDIDLRETLGVFDPATAIRERCTRASEREELTKALTEESLLPSGSVPGEPPVDAALRYLGRTASALAAVQIEDATGELNQPNMPGMDAGHPNWRRRLSISTEAMTAPGGPISKTSVIMAEEGRDRHGRSTALASLPPRATYRLQFHKDFTFDDAVEIVPYLARLGISHVYASPIHTAAPGSTHGYDIVDHSAVNPELGGEAGFCRLSEALAAHGLKLLLDIVPNHMGVGGQANEWWLSVLEWGRLSPVADAFDIDWERPGACGKLIIPSLGRLYGEALESGELKLSFDVQEGSFSVWHWEHRFPICPLTYPMVLDRALAAVGDRAALADLTRLVEQFRTLDKISSGRETSSLPAAADALKRDLSRLVQAHPSVRKAIDATIEVLNGTLHAHDTVNALHRLLEAQAYRLAYWRVAASDINYRRFFDVNTLAGLKVEIPEIFEKTHALIAHLIKYDVVHGLRIDHIDGLADPETYTHALQRKFGPGFYIVVEKILEHGETLRLWPVAGTTGYDALNLIDGVLTETGAAETVEQVYREASHLKGNYDTLLRQAKIEITQSSFASELSVLVSDAKAIADAHRRTRDYTSSALRQALTDLIAAFPVYRSYLGDRPPSPEDVALIQASTRVAQQISPLPDRTVHDFVASALLGEATAAAPEDVHRFRRRFQQLTGPVMAKSLEDTLFYRYGRLIALNEVGGDPAYFGVSPAAFHEENVTRSKNWPNTMIATATHDTKRGEDARARLLALSEIPDQWAQTLTQWREIIAPLLTSADDAPAPDPNDQVILLQAILGAWPLELLDGDDANHIVPFRERMGGYVTKALREAKRHTNWTSPNEAYERATIDLLEALLLPQSAFLDRFRPLARRLSHLGMLNGLSRTVLKMTLPGVPDIYQGTEFWDFSLVDPDNRRPVDYGRRRDSLELDTPVEELLAEWRDGRIKQHLLAKLLHDRRENAAFYAEADYRPIDVTGDRAHHVIAFARTDGADSLAVVVPRLWAGLIREGQASGSRIDWADTAVALDLSEWRDVLTGRSFDVTETPVQIGKILTTLPFAVLRARRQLS